MVEICPQCRRYGVLTNGKCDSCRKIEANNSLPGGHVNWLRGQTECSGPPTLQASSMADTCPPGTCFDCGTGTTSGKPFEAKSSLDD